MAAQIATPLTLFSSADDFYTYRLSGLLAALGEQP